MSDFSEALAKFNITAADKVNAVFVGMTDEVKRSVVEGSTLTGAPGQPVQTGNLKTSWQAEFLSPTLWQLSTNVEYALYIENGENARGPFNPARGAPRSEVGGYHSVKLTRDGFPRIAESVAAKVASE